MTSYYSQTLTACYRTQAEELKQFRQARRSKEAKKRFIESFLLFAATVARNTAAGSMPDDELISVANDALEIAFDRYQPARGRFTSYATVVIRGRVRNAMRERIRRLRRTVSLEALLDEDDDEACASRLDPALTVPSPIEEIETRDLRAVVGPLLNKLQQMLLTPRQRTIFHLRIHEQKSFSQIAVAVGISKAAAHSLFNRGLERLREAFGPRFKSKW